MSEAVLVLDDALELLRCPVCGAGLARAGAAVRCAEGHSFDVARQGYVNLAGGRGRPSGDSAAMVAARERFLAGGYFEPLAEALATALVEALAGRVLAEQPRAEQPRAEQPRAEQPRAELPRAEQPRAEGQPAAVVDLGAGTGWYLARVLDRLPGALGLALDASAPALRRAARAHPRAAAVGCDVWDALPLRDGVAGAVLNVFAPRNGPEVARVLCADGAALVVTPGAEHLAELVEPLGLLRVDERKEARLTATLEPHLRIVERRALEWPLRLGRAAVRDLVAMGPSAFHVEPATLAGRVAALPDPVEVTASVTIGRAEP